MIATDSHVGEITYEGESNMVKRLRALGAIFIGKVNQNEIGICPRGLNIHFGSTRNPYNPNFDTGGSSSGSGASVASGFSPISLGADGGGSIRIPSAFCGLYGLKPTMLRLSADQTTTPIAYTIGVAGPLCANAIDMTLAFAALVGRRDNDPFSHFQPRNLHLDEIKLSDPNYFSLNGKKIGIYSEYFEDVSDKRISAMCMKFIKDVFCEHYGAELRQDVVIPLLEAGRISHLASIAGKFLKH